MLDTISRSCAYVGRTLLHFDFEPLVFFLGVFFLWTHQRLESVAIPHRTLASAW